MKKNLVIVGGCALGFVLCFAAMFALAAWVVFGAEKPVSVNSVTSFTASELSDQPTLFLRSGAAISSDEVLADLSVVDNDGNPLPITPEAFRGLETLDGHFDSLATIDLSALDSGATIRFEPGAVIATLQPGDLLLLNDFIAPLLLIIVPGTLINTALAIVAFVAVKRLIADAMRS